MSDTDETHPWTECIAHPEHTDRDCDYCQSELDVKNTVLQQMQRDIKSLDQQLYRVTGMPFLATAPIVQAVKIECLVEMILTDPKYRMVYELNFGNRIREIMKTALENANRQRLMANGHQQQGLIIKGR